MLSDKLGKPFGPVRVAVDLFFALSGFALGGVLGLGTVICAFVVGPAAQTFMAGEPAYLRWLCPSICREGLPPER